LICCAGIASAQNNNPIPITIDNATDLQPLTIVGSALPGKLAYSPDGLHILAATTEHTAVYRADDLSAAPKIFPFSAFDFNPAGELVADGQIWNLNTGLSVGIAAATRVLPPSEESPTTRIEITKPGGEVIKLDLGQSASVSQVLLDSAYTRAVVITQTSDYGLSTLWLYSLPDGMLYASLPQGDIWIDNLFFSSGTASTSDSLVIASIVPYEGIYRVNVYDAKTGVLRGDYSGVTYNGLRANADKSVFAYDLQDSRLIVSADNVFTVITENIDLTHDDFNRITVSGEFIILEQRGGDLSVYGIDAENIPTSPQTFPRAADFYGETSVQGKWMTSNNREQMYIWDMTAPDVAPRILNIDVYDSARLRINLDGTRILYKVTDERRILRDLTTDTVLVDVPADSVLSPDWSTLAYWDFGQVVVRNLSSQTDTTLDVIPNYLGRVVDLTSNLYIAFSGQSLQIGAIRRGNPIEYFTIPLSNPVPYDATFLGGGESILVVQEGGIFTEFIAPSGEPYRESFTSDYIRGAFILWGNYAISYDNSCDYMYGNSFTYVVPFTDWPMNDLDDSKVISILDGCRADSFAFTDAQTTLYATNGRLLRFDLTTAQPEQVALLTYPSPADGSQYFNVRGVRFSPDEQMIALGVEIYDEMYQPHTALTEVFRTADLAPQSTRADLEPILTIPNTRYATFSPDNQFLLTETGLYSLEGGLVNPDIHGTISMFSPDSTLIATYQDGYVTLWNIPHAEVVAYPLAQYALDGVTELGFSPDGSRLYVVRGGDVQVWGIGNP